VSHQARLQLLNADSGPVADRIGIYLVQHRQMRATLDRAPVDETNSGSVANMQLCGDTMSVHYMDLRYRSRWVTVGGVRPGSLPGCLAPCKASRFPGSMQAGS